jgi:glycosyltransferase involved in cell wall biosynthesis
MSAPKSTPELSLEMEKPPRVRLVTDQPAVGEFPLLREFARKCVLDVVVDSANGRVEPLTWEGTGDQAVRRANKKRRPDIVISRGFGARALQAQVYCKRWNVPLIAWCLGTRNTESGVNGYRKVIRRFLVRASTRLWAAGQESTLLLTDYGGMRAQIDRDMVGVDTPALSEAIARLLPERQGIRTALGLRGPTLLYTGELNARKGIEEYLEALTILHAARVKFSVIFAGEGPQGTVIRHWKTGFPEVPCVIVEAPEIKNLTRFYAAADLFVLPTLEDDWARSSLEAAVAGLPQVYSQYNGASADLAAFGAAGVCINPCDIEAFVQALKDQIADGPRRMPNVVRELLAGYYSPAQFADRAIRSVAAALKQSQDTARPKEIKPVVQSAEQRRAGAAGS